MTRVIFSLLILTSVSQCLSAQYFPRDDNPQESERVVLRDAHLSTSVKADILKVISKDLASASMPQSPEAQTIALTSWVSDQKLSSPGKLAILVESGPDNPATGATGNHAIWVFRRVGNDAVLVLEGFGSMQGPDSTSSHHGLWDFQTYEKIGCCKGSNVVYRFNGTRYMPAYCFDSDTLDGEFAEKKGPRKSCK